ncbi:hypothetical protein [Streptomyces sp. MspMP-M5]|nr:hypothetical protein [Streptomyces sp. MspMP-M5]MYT27359.1 hypothetical protein [Streptomyces sp. SID8354]
MPTSQPAASAPVFPGSWAHGLTGTRQQPTTNININININQLTACIAN